MKLDIIMLQMSVSLGDVDHNIKKIKGMLSNLQETQGEGMRLIVLPEMWSCGYDLEGIEEHSSHTSEILEYFKAYAAQFNAFIIPGSIPVASVSEGGTKRFFNRTFLINPKGEIINQYDKTHLFRAMKEDKYFKPGECLNMVTLDDDIVLTQYICYDLRFPEIFRAQVQKGTNIFVLMAQWPNPRMNHWRSLLIARAIENQAFVVAVNRTGKDEIGSFFGHSMIIDPWGTILFEADDNEGVFSHSIDPTQANIIRTKLPFLKDIRYDI